MLHHHEPGRTGYSRLQHGEWRSRICLVYYDVDGDGNLHIYHFLLLPGGDDNRRRQWCRLRATSRLGSDSVWPNLLREQSILRCQGTMCAQRCRRRRRGWWWKRGDDSSRHFEWPASDHYHAVQRPLPRHVGNNGHCHGRRKWHRTGCFRIGHRQRHPHNWNRIPPLRRRDRRHRDRLYSRCCPPTAPLLLLYRPRPLAWCPRPPRSRRG